MTRYLHEAKAGDTVRFIGVEFTGFTYLKKYPVIEMGQLGDPIVLDDYGRRTPIMGFLRHGFEIVEPHRIVEVASEEVILGLMARAARQSRMARTGAGDSYDGTVPPTDAEIDEARAALAALRPYIDLTARATARAAMLAISACQIPAPIFPPTVPVDPPSENQRAGTSDNRKAPS